MAKIIEAFKKQDWAAAEAAVADAEKALPADEVEQLDRVRLAILFAKKDYPAAYKMADRISAAHKDDAVLQNELAWRIVNDKQIEKRDLGVAETIATRANDASKVALFHLHRHLRERRFELFDIQLLTPITRQLGAVAIPREEYLQRLAKAAECRCSF